MGATVIHVIYKSHNLTNIARAIDNKGLMIFTLHKYQGTNAHVQLFYTLSLSFVLFFNWSVFQLIISFQNINGPSEVKSQGS